jgi:hypothetical protein
MFAIVQVFKGARPLKPSACLVRVIALGENKLYNQKAMANPTIILAKKFRKRMAQISGKKFS